MLPKENSVAMISGSKLSLWGIENDDAEKIIEILIKENFINEARFAAAFVRDKFKYNKWGKIKIACPSQIQETSS